MASFRIPMPNHVFAREIRNTQILGRMCERAMYQRPKPHGPLEDDPCVDFIIKKFDLQGDDDMPTIIRKMAAARAAEAAEAVRAANEPQHVSDFLPPLEFFDSGVPLPPLEFSDSTASAAVDEKFEPAAQTVYERADAPRPTVADEFQEARPKTSAAKRPRTAVADGFQETRPETSAAKRPKTAVVEDFNSAALEFPATDDGPKPPSAKRAVETDDGPGPETSAAKRPKKTVDKFQGTRPKTSAAKRPKAAASTNDGPKPPPSKRFETAVVEESDDMNIVVEEDNNDKVWEEDLQDATEEIDEQKRSQKKKKIEAPEPFDPVPEKKRIRNRKVEMTDKKMSALRKTADLVKKSRYDCPADSDIYVLENFDLLDLSEDAMLKLDNYIRQISHIVNLMANNTIISMVNQGLAIEKKCQLAQKANKKATKKQIYTDLATFMNLKGSEEANSRWFQGRQAIAKIKDILNLGEYSYSMSAADLMKMAPQILQAYAVGFFD